MTPRLSGHFSVFGLAFFALKSLLGIARQYRREKFAILSKKPQSHDTERWLLWANYPCSLYYESPEQSIHERLHWCAVNQTRSRHMKRNSNCFVPNWAVYFLFAGCITIVFRYKAECKWQCKCVLSRTRSRVVTSYKYYFSKLLSSWFCLASRKLS